MAAAADSNLLKRILGDLVYQPFKLTSQFGTFSVASYTALNKVSTYLYNVMHKAILYILMAVYILPLWM